MRVMIVEDDLQSRELLTLRPESLGCEVSEAVSADEAFDQAVSERPELILLDLKLSPEPHHETLQGVDVLQRLRQDPRTAHIPVIIHSIYVRFPQEAPAGMPEVQGYLNKPFKVSDLKQLLGEIRALTP